MCRLLEERFGVGGHGVVGGGGLGFGLGVPDGVGARTVLVRRGALDAGAIGMIDPPFRLNAVTAVLQSGEDIERRHAGHGGDGDAQAATVVPVGVQTGGEQAEVHGVARHARPQKSAGIALHDTNPGGEFAGAERAQEVVVIVRKSDQPRDLARGEKLGEPEPDAENGQTAGE